MAPASTVRFSPTTAWNRVRHWPEWPLVGMILGAKLLVFGYGVVAVQVLADRPVRFPREVFENWSRWDAANYLDVAQHGYQSSGREAAFLVLFPLFPWLIRAFAWLFGSALAGAIAISTVSSVVAGVLLRRLLRLDAPDAVAERAVWLLFIFPTSYFLHIGYTESLFLALLLGCFLAARQGRWLIVAGLALLAGMTRINALILVPALALEAWAEYRRTGRFRWGFVGIAAVGLGFAVYLWLNHAVTGDPFAFLRIQSVQFHRAITWPWIGLAGSWRTTFFRGPRDAIMVGAAELAFSLLGLVAMVASWRMRPSYAVWMTGNWLLFTSYSFLLCVPRYTLVMFPLFLFLSRLAEDRIVLQVLTIVSLLSFALFAGIFALGYWAF